ncbi:hypothetical protein K491DRAFT_782480 [Lophiostoma macrostomum CBS 122681]|uniref:FAD-binding domain-containing protein n=1 Tax=Lophiostoma macrostomum CBS 122681 TaxID=1314788 RepID=A0A6A6SSF5_9PLEO|nr:hypothetical protein K491DRAFT_782480 [Lophiostoma macrostomum CBS 122681]
MTSQSTTTTSVLIVGGGLSGLTAAVALGIYGIPTILIERRASTLQHPRADGFTPRTVEIYRSLGFSQDEIPEKPADFKLRRVRVESLAGKWFDELAWNPQEDEKDVEVKVYSPYNGCTTPQDLLEPVIQKRAIELGVDIRRGHEFVGLAQEGEEVIATLKDDRGEVYEIQAKYVVAADGSQSRVREALGVTRSGHGHVHSTKSVLFRAPSLVSYTEKGFTQFTIDQPDLKGLLLVYKDGRLVLHLPNDREFTEEGLRSLVYKAVGKPESEIDVKFMGSSRWDVGGFIAERIGIGRVFLIGDSAHSLPPNRGGYGVNTGIADAQNIAWKLTSVLKGNSDPSLLETYEAERLPVAWLRHDQIFARADFKTLETNGSTRKVEVELLEDDAIEFGQIYRSTGILQDTSKDLPDAQLPDAWAGQPGTRAPHVIIEVEGRRISTLNLFGRHWILLTSSDVWAKALKEVCIQQNRSLGVVSIHADGAEFLEKYALRVGGCSLVRPDGYVAWRSATTVDAPKQILREALGKVMFL